MEIVFNTKEQALHAFEGMGCEIGRELYRNENVGDCISVDMEAAMWAFAIDGKPMCLHLFAMDSTGDYDEICANWYASSQDNGTHQ